jgi:hypothetical protein
VRHATGVKKPNLHICNLQLKTVIHSLDVSVAPERWPPIFFSEKETYFFHLVNFHTSQEIKNNGFLLIMSFFF